MLLDMAQCGNIAGLTAEHTADMGATMLKVGALAKLGRTEPPFIVVDAVQLSRDNMVDVYKTAYLADLPQSVLDALNTSCTYAPLRQ